MKMKIDLSRFFGARMVAGALTLAAAQFAHAHANPTHQVPPAGATAAATLNEVAIDFDDSLEPAFSSIDVTDAQGKSMTRGKATVDKANQKHMSVALSALSPGKCTVTWVAVASDGHRTQGHYAFTVK